MAQAHQAETRPKAPAPKAPGLYLVTPPVSDAAAFAGTLGSALATVDIAAVLLRLKPAGERDLIERVKALATVVQPTGTALVLDGHAGIVARAGADGAHLTGAAAFTEAVETLKPARIAGCGGLATRHDAMTAGERGADYVMFGDPDTDGHRASFAAIIERIEWWSELFEIPCVGFAAELHEVAPLIAAGADFVAVGHGLWDDPRGAVAVLADMARQLAMPEPAA
jgi:thiamine-phosphate pyrophosphorylase